MNGDPEPGHVNVRLRDANHAQLETCEYCGATVAAVHIHYYGEDERPAWWEPVNLGGVGEHTPERCRTLRRRKTP